MERLGRKTNNSVLEHGIGPCLFIKYRKLSGREWRLECILS